MKHLTNFVAAGVVAACAAFSPTDADALFLDGVFEIDIYNFDAAGTASNANATETNRNSRTSIATVTWDGFLDFNIGPNPQTATTTISSFFSSGTGTVNGLSSTVGNLILSGGAGGGDDGGLADTDSTNGSTFRETTLFDITAKSFRNISDMSQIWQVTHDDGFTLSDGSDPTVAFASPTGRRETPVSGLTGGFGDFSLIYVATNGDPSILEVNVVPLPAAAWLLLAASGGLIAAKRRRARSAA